jgi:hypothetical protein
MAKRPRNKKVDRSIIEQGGTTPIRALTAALINRSERREDEEYQDSLREMGMLNNAGGRGGGVRGGMAPKKMKKDRKVQNKKYGGKVAKMKEGGLVGGQHKLDKNKDGKISGADFKMMEYGGEVKKMKYGGKVGGCRGGGAAMAGTKFSGCK